MSGWAPIEGGTLHIASGGDGLHLFAIVIGPRYIASRGPQGQFLLIPFCSQRDDGRHDNTCLMVPSDQDAHPFIVHPSYADYRYYRVDGESDLRKHVENKLFVPGEGISSALLGRVRAGVHASPRLVRYIKDEFC